MYRIFVYINLKLKIFKSKNIKLMAGYLKDDSSFTHVIAIDFGTGASGYS